MTGRGRVVSSGRQSGRQSGRRSGREVPRRSVPPAVKGYLALKPDARAGQGPGGARLPSGSGPGRLAVGRPGSLQLRVPLPRPRHQFGVRPFRAGGLARRTARPDCGVPCRRAVVRSRCRHPVRFLCLRDDLTPRKCLHSGSGPAGRRRRGRMASARLRAAASPVSIPAGRRGPDRLDNGQLQTRSTGGGHAIAGMPRRRSQSGRRSLRTCGPRRPEVRRNSPARGGGLVAGPWFLVGSGEWAGRRVGRGPPRGR